MSGGIDSTIIVRGLPELERALMLYGDLTKKEMKKTLATVAEPVKRRATGLADSNISRIGHRWDQMRIGVIPSGVYIAPASRRRKGGSPRPNLAGLLLNKSMIPAVTESEPEVLTALKAMLDVVAAESGFL